jgi:flagellar biosynthesis/type III secretory pathway protein FliH
MVARMAAIIRSAVIAPEGRRLRRGGAELAAAATPAAPVADVPAVPALPAALELPGDASMLAREWALLREREAELRRAEAQLAAQRQQAAELERQLLAARKEVADGRAETLADAERRGLALGREQAEREVAGQTAAHGERVNIVLAALAQSGRRALDEQEDMLVEIVFTAVCRILGATGTTRAAIDSMVRGLVAAEREPAQVRVRLHPADLALLADGASGFDPRLVLQADDAMGMGGCVIDGPRGSLDARFELQLAQLRATLLAVRGAANKNEVPV